jgi:8-oxo-dGTP diphosphatase
MLTEKRKVYAYITHHNRLLVFIHPDHPDAGIQVPGGTVEPGESTEAAVMREAFEETGLDDLTMLGFLGEAWRDVSDFGVAEIHHRFYYHLAPSQDPPERWTHYERFPSTGETTPIRFEFYWVDLPDAVPELIGDLGQMLGILTKDNT